MGKAVVVDTRKTVLKERSIDGAAVGNLLSLQTRIVKELDAESEGRRLSNLGRYLPIPHFYPVNRTLFPLIPA